MTSVLRDQQNQERENHTERTATDKPVAWKMANPRGPRVSDSAPKAKHTFGPSCCPSLSSGCFWVLHMLLQTKGNENAQKKGKWFDLLEDEGHRDNLYEANGSCFRLGAGSVSLSPRATLWTCTRTSAAHSDWAWRRAASLQVSWTEPAVCTFNSWEFLALSPHRLLQNSTDKMGEHQQTAGNGK